MRGRAMWALLAAVCGCQRTAGIELPPLEGTDPYILMIVADGEIVGADLHDANSALPVLRFGGGSTTIVRAAIYDQPIEALGLAVGPIAWTSGADDVPIPTPSSTYQLTDPLAGWSPEQPRSGDWSKLRAPRAPRPCAVLEANSTHEQAIEDSTSTGRSFAASHLGEGFGAGPTSVVGNHVGVWWATRDNAHVLATVTATHGLTITSTGPILAAYRAPANKFYVVTRGDVLWGSEPESVPGEGLRFTRLDGPSDAGTAAEAWLHGSNPQSAFELYLLDSDSGLWRFDEIGWTTIISPVAGSMIGDRGGLAWIDTKEVYAIGPMGGQVVRISDERVEVVSPEGMGHATAITQVLDQGIVVGDDRGRVWRRDPDGWRELPAVDGEVTAIGSYFDQGILYGGRDGRLQYYSNNNDCRGTITVSGTVFGLNFVGLDDYQFYSSRAAPGSPGPILITTYER